MSKSQAFDEYRFVVPEIWDFDWASAIEDADGVERELLKSKHLAAQTAQRVEDQVVTPERLAWMSLWTKACVIIDGALGAVGQRSELTLHVLGRIAFESFLHANVIAEPVTRLSELEGSQASRTTVSVKAKARAWSEVVDRMRAYTAWCLVGDRGFYQFALQRSTQKEIWDPEPARALARDPVRLAFHESFLGPVEIPSDHELREAGQEQRANLLSRRERVLKWLADERLTKWTERLEDLGRRPGGKQVAFFELFDDAQGTLKKRLDAIELSFSYLGYKRGSMLVHGSTVDEFFDYGESSVLPILAPIDDKWEQGASDIALWCNGIVMNLALFRERVWSS